MLQRSIFKVLLLNNSSSTFRRKHSSVSQNISKIEVLNVLQTAGAWRSQGAEECAPPLTFWKFSKCILSHSKILKYILNFWKIFSCTPLPPTFFSSSRPWQTEAKDVSIYVISHKIKFVTNKNFEALIQALSEKTR